MVFSYNGRRFHVLQHTAPVIRTLPGGFICRVLYPGSRRSAPEHLDCANINGFNPITTGCQIIIGDGLRGTDDIDVPVPNGEYCKEAHIGRAIMDADIFISLTHFKGHEMTGFGGTIKNIGMGCGSRAGWNWQRDHFKDNNPAIHWKETLAHGEKIGLGSRDYELIVMK